MMSSVINLKNIRTNLGDQVLTKGTDLQELGYARYLQRKEE